jgi:kynurenine formamidase
MSLIDISPALRVGMAVFPGDADYRVAQTFTIGPGCPVNVGSFAMSTHCGAHADAPLHYDAEGATIDQLDIGDFIGPARVIDAGVTTRSAILTRLQPRSTALRRGCCSGWLIESIRWCGRRGSVRCLPTWWSGWHSAARA